MTIYATSGVETASITITGGGSIGVPSGGIIMWSGSVASIPSGWFLCDGSNGTPDLRNRFIVGAGSTYNPSNTGGSADAIVVSHSHTVSDPGHSHGGFRAGNWRGTDDSGLSTQYGGAYNTSSATTGISISNTGSSGTNANLPPYYALAYIMKS